jgi:CrcB protein
MIGALVFAGICVAGGAGASLRFAADGLIKGRFSPPFPAATTVINATGSLILGVLTGAAANAGLPHTWLLIAGGGLMGGYTTFSTASFETFRLAQEGRYIVAAGNGLGMLILAIAAAGLGLWIGASM